ncbi:hypothetical protein ACVWWP_003738 [Bradyrhizobium sp. LM3.6]
MSSMTIGPIAGTATDPSERSALLFWMIFTGLSVFAVVLLWRFGLIRLMLSSDRTYISSVIALLYVLTCGHCFLRTRAIAREGAAARRCRAVLAAPEGGKALDAGATALPRGLVRDHIESLVTKATAQDYRPVDQTLLLRTLADRLRGSNGFGAFVSDTLMKLGLLGTIVGFIIMLAPIAGLDAADKVAMRSSMGLMSDGMAVAMYTTLAGLVGLDPGPHPVLHAGRRDPEGVLGRGGADRDLCDASTGAQGRWNAVMMDDFGLYPREEPFDPLGVMLFKALQVIAFLFFLALLAVSPDAKDGKIDSKAEFMITLDWPDSHPDDLDLFVQDPAGNIAWYRHREAGFLTLDRDDRGGANDFIMVNGKKIASPIREEIVTVRGIVPGEYTVNVSHFVATTGVPVEANVKVQKLNPTAQVVFDNKFMLDHTGDEKTAVRFRLDAEGKVVNVDQRPKSLLETFRSGWRNGADLDPSTGVSKNAARVRRD